MRKRINPNLLPWMTEHWWLIGYFCWGKGSIYIYIVSLPREWFQEIKRMMTVHSTHGLFLTCTQESCLYIFTQCTISRYLHNVCTSNHYRTPCKSNKEPNLLGGQVSCSWWQIPIHSGPLPGSNCPTLWLFHPFPTLSAHITLFTTTTSTITPSSYGTYITSSYFHPLGCFLTSHVHWHLF